MNHRRSDIDLLNSSDIEFIAKEVSFALHKLDSINKVIKEDIFKLLERECRVIYYPIEDEEICAFYRKVDEKKFVYINTAIPFEKQVFAAAHELAHVLGVAEDRSELLQSDAMGDYSDGNEMERSNGGKIEDIANRFAAEFLVQTIVLRDELVKRKCIENKIDIRTIVELMDLFGVPYKTIVRRLHEIGFLSPENCRVFLDIPARGMDSDIVRLQLRLELCAQNNEKTKKKKLADFVDLSLISYEKRIRTFERLNYLLGLAEKTPEQFGIEKVEEHLLSEEELEKQLSESL